jgi:ubiquinone/menaquinone biosynthesis C-methylase UbiE
MTENKSAVTALEARALAQHLAFGPMTFQATRLLWKSGLLKAIEDGGSSGVTLAELDLQTDLSAYGIGVLLEVAVSAGVVAEADGRIALTKVGTMLLHDKLTQINFDFVHDVCYQGLFFLDEAIRQGKPAGLKVFSDADTIYDCVTELPENAQRSWYAFDHFYSDRAFKQAADIIFRKPVKRLMDVGGNTGRWALRCLEKDDTVAVTIADLPGQLAIARDCIGRTPHSHRVSYCETDLLDQTSKLPGDHDVIWMSQFLDCFSEAQIGTILGTVRAAVAPDGRVFIMETFVDRQRYAAATYSLNAISLYFTAMANGNSRMYRATTLERLLAEQGYEVVKSYDDLGLGHTLLECRAV